MTAAVTVAVVSWNTRDLLERCLRSLAPDVDAGRAEVWVWDNASSDGSAKMVERAFPWAVSVRSKENIGYGAAVNEVARRTDGTWIAASNADVEPTPGALATMVAAGDADPSAAAVAPRLVRPDGRTQHCVHPFPTVSVSAVVNLGLQRLSPRLGDRLCLEGHWNPERPRQVDWAHGAFLLMRREAFQAVGGFEPRQWMYAEDLDLQWRLARAGWTTRYEPRAVVRHEVGAATRKAFADRRAARHTAASYAWMLRRRGALVTRSFALVNLGGAAVRVLLLAGPAMARPARFGDGLERARLFARLHLRGLRSPRAILRHR